MLPKNAPANGRKKVVGPNMACHGAIHRESRPPINAATHASIGVRRIAIAGTMIKFNDRSDDAPMKTEIGTRLATV